VALDRPPGAEAEADARGQPAQDEEALEREGPGNAGASEVMAPGDAPESRDDGEGASRRLGGRPVLRPRRPAERSQEQCARRSAADSSEEPERGQQRPGERDVDAAGHGVSVNEAGGPHGSKPPSRYGTTDQRP